MTARAISSLMCVPLLGALSPFANADPLAFAMGAHNNFFSPAVYEVNLATGATTSVAAAPFIDSSGYYQSLALSPAGDLFSWRRGVGLVSIETSTNTWTFVGSDPAEIYGLDYRASELVGATAGFFPALNTFLSINESTGATTPIVTTNTSLGFLYGIAIKDPNTALAIATPDHINMILSSVDLTTGVVTSIGPTEYLTGGIDFASDGILYGIADGGQIYQINESTGAATLVANTGTTIGWGGLATIPAAAAVPEPSCFVLAGALLGFLIINRGTNLAKISARR